MGLGLGLAFGLGLGLGLGLGFGLAARLDGEDVQVAEGLQVVAVVRRGEGEAREDGGEQRGDGGLGGAEGKPAAAKEEEAQRHRDGHVEAVGHLPRLRV